MEKVLFVIVGAVFVFAGIFWVLEENAKYVQCQHAGELYDGPAHRVNGECYIRINGEVKSWNELHKPIEPKD